MNIFLNLLKFPVIFPPISKQFHHSTTLTHSHLKAFSVERNRLRIKVKQQQMNHRLVREIFSRIFCCAVSVIYAEKQEKHIVRGDLTRARLDLREIEKDDVFCLLACFSWK